MRTLFLDFETFSTQPISVGAYAYAEQAEVLIGTYAFDDGPVGLWDRSLTPDMPNDLNAALSEPTITVVAHNAQFDRVVLRASLGKYVPIERWRCTMCKALVHGFPGSLDQLGRILGLAQDQAKLTDGKRLIHKFCKPAPKNHKADRYDRESHPEDWGKFCDYAVRDIEAMRAIDRLLPDWNARGGELELYHLDQRINDHGFPVDRKLVEAGIRAATQEKTVQAARFAELTEGVVTRPTQREKFRAYLNTRFGLRLANTQARTLQGVMATPGHGLPQEALELMQISISSNKTSTAKYAALEPALSSDGRFRGGLQFSGAARTRRWSGRNFQPQNIPGRGLPPQKDIEAYIAALKAGVHDLLFDDLMLHGSAALRGVLVPSPGTRLVVADLANIEGRANAWLAGETWKLEAFEAFDRGAGPDLYNVTAAQILGTTPDQVTKPDRNAFGKVPELALGYAGGVGALQTFARSYGLTMSDYWGTVCGNMASFEPTARENYTAWGRARDPELPELEWVASETVKLAWRDRHPKIVKLWKACELAAKRALETPGTTCRAGPHLRFRAVAYAGHTYLLIRLPSGNFLTYFHPRLEADGTLSHMGLNGLTRQWERQTTYGGRLCIAEGVPVLTRRGWVPIQKVQITDRIWDGNSWVYHSGLVAQGEKPTIEAHGVRMTSDHQVLTTVGWKHASQSAGFDRFKSRIPYGHGVRWKRWAEIPMASDLCLREQDHMSRNRIFEDEETQSDRVLRMHENQDARRETPPARDVETPSSCCLGIYAGAMLQPVARRLAELRRTWDFSLFRMAEFVRGLLGGYGPLLPDGAVVGAAGQQCRVFPRKLFLGNDADTGQQQENESCDLHPEWTYDGVQCRSSFRNWPLHSSAQDHSRLAAETVVRKTYDLIKCGPRRRFVVRDKDGSPLIVHNCENTCQSLSRDILAANMPAIEAAGFDILLTVHDEIVTEAPTGQGLNTGRLVALMTQQPSWAAGFPLAAAGFEADRYRKEA